MSQVFSSTDRSQPGYFRIGHVVLQIPPTDISTNKVVNDDQVATLRAISPTFIKSGQARWDVTVRWKAVLIILPDKSTDMSQWLDLQQIVAIFKAAPFVEVDNDFLRQHFASVHPAYTTQRMAFAMKQLRIDTSDSDVLDVTLTMSLFNYAPYSKDFGYKGAIGPGLPHSTDANKSLQFRDFIASYIATNINKHPAERSSPPIKSWIDQEEGVFTFKWRKYVHIPFRTTPPPAANPVAPGTTSTNNFPAGTTKRVPDTIQSAINAASVAENPHLDPAIVSSLLLAENPACDPNAGRGRIDGGGLGLFQIVLSTGKQLGLNGEDFFDPIKNTFAACKLLRQLLTKYGNYPSTLAAYNVGPAVVNSYLTGTPFTYKTGKFAGFVVNPTGTIIPNGIAPDGTPPGEHNTSYVTRILARVGKSSLVAAPRIVAAPTTTKTSAFWDSPNEDLVLLVEDTVVQLAQSNPIGVWYLDHYTEFGVFYYQEQQFTLANGESNVLGDFAMFPSQLSIVMVNNLPTIPLSAQQYPTFQHVGPADTMITIGMESVGEDDSILSEPSHPGIQALANMSDQLASQFHQLRTTFRAVSSIHRMQAVYLENQVLNLLGIKGVMLRGLNSETVPEATELVQVSVLASQYENVFEETAPYRLNGLTTAYSAQLKTIMTTGMLNDLSKEEQDVLTAARDFANNYTSLNPQYLLDQILHISTESNNFLGTCLDLPDALLNPFQRQYLLQNMDLPASRGEINSTASTFIKSIFSFTSSSLTQDTIFPGIQSRRLSLQRTNVQMTFADYFVFSQLPVQTDSVITAKIRTANEAKFASQEFTDGGLYQILYEHLLDWKMQTDPQFAYQISTIVHSPTFSGIFTDAATVDGPSSQPSNQGHVCYPDLGLTDYSQNPADYMYDYNADLQRDTNDEITQLLDKTNAAASSFNQIQTVSGPIDAKTLDANKGVNNGVTFVDNGQGLPGSAAAFIRMIRSSAYSMATAYPTFKLMLIEEDNKGPFFAFDNFYSYSSVMDIEIIKYRDKPDTAIIKITNLANLLHHRLYDDTAAGKMEAQADKFNISSSQGVTTGGPGIAPGDVGTGVGAPLGLTAARSLEGKLWQSAPRKNMSEGTGETYSKIPLKFFALQTGSKIQVRMGFSNNPDNLFPVFTGQVTEIEGEEVLTITCQSFMLELMNTPGVLVKADSIWGFNFASGGAAYGGWSLDQAGDATNVMKTMLSSPASKHFGHWQVAGVTDQLLKGNTWVPLGLATNLSKSSNKSIAAIASLVLSGYDRSGENILVNSIINYDSQRSPLDKNNLGRRKFDSENPNIISGTAQYSVEKTSKLSLWDLLKDISRRYPHYNLMIKDYGFPYGADATLVYAHPLDWYWSRYPLFGEAEKEKANNATQGPQFATWWTTAGLGLWNEAWRGAYDSVTFGTNPGSGLLLKAKLYLIQSDLTALAGTGPVNFANAITLVHQILTGTFIATTGDGILGTIGALLNGVDNTITEGIIGGNVTQGFFTNLDNNFQSVARQWDIYMKAAEPATNSSRLKPVRKYHLIDFNHIIHNGISVNDNIYNAVRIKDKALKFNQNIPDQHIRMLDVTDMINNPEMNVLTGSGDSFQSNVLLNAYGQSFLREEVGKMYEGELIIRGTPDIEPFDVILLSDPATGIVGPIEVDTVIHSFNMENGYITIVKPRLLLLANETVSVGLFRTLGFAWANASANLMDLGNIFNPFDISTTSSARAIELAAGLVLATGAATSLALAWALPLIPALGILSLTAGYGIMMYLDSTSKANFFQLMPLSRYGRAWVGGLQGFATSNFAYSIGQSFKWFDAEEIAPTIESWHHVLLHYNANYGTQP